MAHVFGTLLQADSSTVKEPAITCVLPGMSDPNTDRYVINLLLELRPLAAPGIRMLEKLEMLKRQFTGTWTRLPDAIADLESTAIVAGLAEPRKTNRKDRDPTELIDIGGNLKSAAQAILRTLDKWQDSIAKAPEVAQMPHEILCNNALSWEMHSLLWDSCYPDADRDMQTRQYGTVKPRLMKDLQMLGLAFPYNLPRNGSRGRPMRTIVPTSWGKRLIEITDRLGLKPNPQVRPFCRYANGKRSPHKKQNTTLMDHYARLGLKLELPPPPNRVEEPPPVEVMPEEEYGPIRELVDTRRTAGTVSDSVNIEVQTPDITAEELQARLDQEHAEIPVQYRLQQLLTGPPVPSEYPDYQGQKEKEPFVIDHRDLPEDWDKEES